MEHETHNPFYTLTMARVYANQGELDEAIRIYRYLLSKAPDREDLKTEMDAVQTRMPKLPENWSRVAAAIEHWTCLLIHYDALRRFLPSQNVLSQRFDAARLPYPDVPKITKDSR